MRIAYFDCFSGISGDMVLGALLDAGVDYDELLSQLELLPLSRYTMRAKPVTRGGLAATKVSVSTYEKGLVRTWTNIHDLIDTSPLSPAVKEKSLAIFLLLAGAEAKIHRKEIDKVHFHEVGAVDSIIDIVGAVIGLNLLGIEKIYFSPLPMGVGMVRSEHGVIPIPAPATLEILKDVPLYSTGITAELVTPTGAAIAKSYAAAFEPPPPIKIESIGYGAGKADLDIPNVLRLMVGQSTEEPDSDMVTLIETNIDNVSPEVSGFLIDRLLAAGAADVWLTPILMKKDRPGQLVSMLAPLGAEEELLDILIRESGSLGARLRTLERRKAGREVVKVDTDFGAVSVKVGRWRGETIAVTPEFDDCAALARQTGKPLREIYAAAIEAYREGRQIRPESRKPKAEK